MKPRTIMIVIALLALFAVGLYATRDVLTLDALAQRESQLRAWVSQQPVAAYGIAFLIYVAVAGLSLPGAAVLTLTYGWFFGLVQGVILVSFGSTAGATVAFLVSRYLFRDAVQRRFGDRLAKFNAALEAYGAYFLFTLRLVFLVPFFVINLVMGLTPIGTWTFWWVSQLGMLPGTAVYVYAGSAVPSIQALAEEGVGAVFTPTQMTQLFIAFGLLGVFPLLVRATLSYFGLATPLANEDAPGDEVPAPSEASSQ